jgi:hypothetical protein
MKLSGQNPGYSIKDRIARAMIEDAERQGLIAPGRTSSSSPRRETPASGCRWWRR